MSSTCRAPKLSSCRLHSPGPGTEIPTAVREAGRSSFEEGSAHPEPVPIPSPSCCSPSTLSKPAYPLAFSSP